jgi:HAD superfamily hydrolase (TIGR01509 family)
MRLKALIFDVDGTLADTEEIHRRAFNEAFRQHGLDWNWSQPRYAELLRTTGGKERIAEHMRSLVLSEAERAALIAGIPALHQSKTSIYTRLVAGGDVPLRDGVLRLIDEALARGVRLAIATTTSLENIAALLQTSMGSDALHRFDAIGAGDQVRHKKPAPDIYELVLAELALPASECIAIEDSINGLRSAKAAGLCTVITPCYWTLTDDFTMADVVLPSLGGPGGIDIAALDQLLSARAAAP